MYQNRGIFFLLGQIFSPFIWSRGSDGITHLRKDPPSWTNWLSVRDSWRSCCFPALSFREDACWWCLSPPPPVLPSVICFMKLSRGSGACFSWWRPRWRAMSARELSSTSRWWSWLTRDPRTASQTYHCESGALDVVVYIHRGMVVYTLYWWNNISDKWIVTGVLGFHFASLERSKSRPPSKKIFLSDSSSILYYVIIKTVCCS